MRTQYRQYRFIVTADFASIRALEDSQTETDLSTTITVRGLDPVDKSWLKRQSRQDRVSMEEFVRRLIRERREKTERRPKPSEAFRRHFGPNHGVELELDRRYRSTALTFSE